MQNDPETLDSTFSKTSVFQYLEDYSKCLVSALKHVEPEQLDKAHQAMWGARQKQGRIFVAGNGGSAAISNHLCCDWQKGTHVKGHKSLLVQSLAANTPLLTALGNDLGYERVFSFQLECADLQPNDLVLLVSSSGNSPNIIDAATLARERGATIIGMTGFSGGKLRQLAHISLHIPVANYGVVEDAHQMLMHVLAQFHAFDHRKEISPSA